MIWSLFGAKALPEPMTYRLNSLTSREQTWGIYDQTQTFPLKKIIWKCLLKNVSHLVSGSMCELSLICDILLTIFKNVFKHIFLEIFSWKYLNLDWANFQFRERNWQQVNIGQWQSSGSTLAQVMACCLTAPSHYLNLYIMLFFFITWTSVDLSSENFSPVTFIWGQFHNRYPSHQ